MTADARAEPVSLPLTSVGPDATLAIGRAVGRRCVAGDVVALRGELGAGKTQFVRGLAAGLGLDAGAVSSPTFVFVHEHEPDPPVAADGSPRLALIHVDAYRATDADTLASLGFDLDDASFRETAVVAVEWPERLAEAGAGVPADALAVSLEHAPPSRVVTLTIGASWAGRVAALRGDLASFMTTGQP